ncbi:MAG TPA: hypothetical protein VGJ77_08175 [Gaiellaceae bacterium]|jgi:hypothetical protein
MKQRLSIAAVAIVALTPAANAGVDAGGGTRVTRDRVTFQVPADWHLTLGRLNGVVDPVTVFTVSTFPLRPAPVSSGVCEPALQRAWRPDGAFYVFYGLGPDASRDVRAAAAALLDGMRIAPRKPA